MRCVLITNLSWVHWGPFRTYSNALLLQATEDTDPQGVGRGPRFKARGFRTAGNLPTFDLMLPSIDHRFEVDPIPDWLMSMNGRNATPHGTLKIIGDDQVPDGIELKLDVNTIDGRSIDFEQIDGDGGCEFLDAMWERMEAKVAHYHEAPNICTANYVTTELVRRAHPLRTAPVMGGVR